MYPTDTLWETNIAGNTTRHIEGPGPFFQQAMLVDPGVYLLADDGFVYIIYNFCIFTYREREREISECIARFRVFYVGMFSNFGAPNGMLLFLYSLVDSRGKNQANPGL